jgi:hypothetical protein
LSTLEHSRWIRDGADGATAVQARNLGREEKKTGDGDKYKENVGQPYSVNDRFFFGSGNLRSLRQLPLTLT